MDLNRLLFEHQLALIKARFSVPGPTRSAYFKIAAHYAHRLREYRRSRKVQQYDDHHNDNTIRLHHPKAPSDVA
jgi:hypothetical protein